MTPASGQKMVSAGEWKNDGASPAVKKINSHYQSSGSAIPICHSGLDPESRKNDPSIMNNNSEIDFD